MGRSIVGGASSAARIISRADFGGHSAERSRDGDKAGIAGVGGSINVVARRKEGVETLYKIGISMKEHRHTLYYTRSIDSETDMSIPVLGGANNEKA